MIQNPGWNIGKTLITQQRQKKWVIDSIAINLKFGSRNYLILQRSNPCPLQWRWGVLLPRKSLSHWFLTVDYDMLIYLLFIYFCIFLYIFWLEILWGMTALSEWLAFSLFFNFNIYLFIYFWLCLSCSIWNLSLRVGSRVWGLCSCGLWA